MSETQEIAVIHTAHGELSIRFWEDVAPKTVENFKTLARKKFYGGTSWQNLNH